MVMVATGVAYMPPTLIEPSMMPALILSSSALRSAGTAESKSWNGARSTPPLFRSPTMTPPLKVPLKASVTAVLGGRVDLLQHRRQEHALVVGVGGVLVGVDADDLELVGADLRGERRRALADLAGDRQDDVGAFVDHALGDVLALVDRVEVADEHAVLLGRIPAEHLHRWCPSACCSSRRPTRSRP